MRLYLLAGFCGFRVDLAATLYYENDIDRRLAAWRGRLGSWE